MTRRGGSPDCHSKLLMVAITSTPADGILMRLPMWIASARASPPASTSSAVITAPETVMTCASVSAIAGSHARARALAITPQGRAQRAYALGRVSA